MKTKKKKKKKKKKEKKTIFNGLCYQPFQEKKNKSTVNVC